MRDVGDEIRFHLVDSPKFLVEAFECNILLYQAFDTLAVFESDPGLTSDGSNKLFIGCREESAALVEKSDIADFATWCLNWYR